MSSKPHNKISQIVRLKQVMQRWRRRCTTTTTTTTSDSDTDSPTNQNHHILPGTLAVYVGPERHRFIIPTRFLNLPVILSLLNKAVEEFGFQKTGGLIIPCDVNFFKKLLNALDLNESEYFDYDLDDFAAMFSDLEIDLNSKKCKDVDGLNCRSFTPLLQKAARV